MAYQVQARLDDHKLSATIEPAKEPFARAIEWQVVERFIDVTKSFGNNTYSIDEFAAVMAREAIRKTAEEAAIEDAAANYGPSK